MNTIDNDILRQLSMHYDRALIYENVVLQQNALDCIPVRQLTERTVKNYGFSELDSEFRDFLLLELLSWFKNEFFTWTDNPKCSNCGSSRTHHEGVVLDTADEIESNQAHRVEQYRCGEENCRQITPFHRYNNPAKLLQTRTGRCGEWANCFTLCARSMGYEVRFVSDTTDHVWTEVWSEHQKRWLHCDPCENACDTPLMYECGWNKKLSHVTAFSRDHIRDVAWRYSVDHKNLTRRRASICSESSLASLLRTLNERLFQRNGGSSARRLELQKQFICELVEFVSPKKNLKQGETQGRISGNLEWREKRGEIGGALKLLDISRQPDLPSTIVPSVEDVNSGGFVVEYYSFDDVYYRFSYSAKKCANTSTADGCNNNNSKSAQSANNGPIQKFSGWRSLLYSCQNVQRKIEKDWRQVYLCRLENSNVNSSGSVCWLFKVDGDALKKSTCNFNPDAVSFESIELRIDSTTFDQGQVRMSICFGDNCQLIRKTDNVIDLNGCREFKIEVYLIDGGNCSTFWQKSQLFRVPFDCKSCSFRADVKLKQL